MIIDFTEIPPANKAGSYQDLFEQFACIFLEDKGFEILNRPDRGPDGKKDLIVKETRNGIGGTTEIKWLVSCKHFAHSNRSVNDVDESDISDRVKKFDCDGFIGFYSTIPSSSLSNKLHSLYTNSKGFEYLIYDHSRIQNELLASSRCATILAIHFPNTYSKYRMLNLPSVNSSKQKEASRESELDLIKTALIILEIDRIEESFDKSNRDDKEQLLDKLFKYHKHTNEDIADSILTFAHSISLSTRIAKNSNIAGKIRSLIHTFFPSSNNFKSEKLIDNGRQCINIGYNMAYDALIWINNFDIAAKGLLIVKYVHMTATSHSLGDLLSEVEANYNDLIDTLNRPERKDLENAKRLVTIFKNDLNRRALDYPDLPQDLFALILQNDTDE